MKKKNNDKIGGRIYSNILKKKIKSRFTDFSNFVKRHYTDSFKILIAYVIFVLVGAGLLFLPISFQSDSMYLKSNGHGFHFIDAIFISSSAFSNTGLTVTDISQTFSGFGQAIIYIWIQLGGFGLLSAFYLVGKFINKTIHKKVMSNSLVCYAERGGTKISDTGKVLFSIFLLSILIQTFFTVVFTSIFFNVKFYEVIPHDSDINGVWEQTANVLPMYNNFGLALWNGLFLTGSAMNNAGFDLFGATSLAPFRNDLGILVQFFTMFLFILGGIGYIVIYDVWRKIEYYIYLQNPQFFQKWFKTNHQSYISEKPTISIFSKICLWAALIIGVLSIGLVYIVEYVDFTDSLFHDKFSEYFNNNPLNSNWSVIFNTLASRSAGFATINMNWLTDITKWLFIIFMFIGTSPASTGGGVRTTTFVVLIRSIFGRIKGTSDINIFKRRISKRTIVDSTNIFALSILSVVAITILVKMLSINDVALANNDVTDFFFETSSAFGTTGFSTGITSNLNGWSYFPLIILMFFGQLGIINSIQMFTNNKQKQNNISYADIEIKLG
ncbi:MAG: TrkH family potassium uptake protein [Mycoplasmoidaceae bacterium]